VKAKRIDHVGIVVDNLESAATFVRDVLGFSFDRQVSIPGRLEAMFFRCGDAAVELIEVTDLVQRRERLGSATARLEHVAVEVEALPEAIGGLSQSGVGMTSATPTITGPIRSYFTRPETSDGVMYQVFEWIAKESSDPGPPP
jgi:catechol 2,3-dioxygenase-like lactoylglutathione lyase family enzyme